MKLYVAQPGSIEGKHPQPVNTDGRLSERGKQHAWRLGKFFASPPQQSTGQAAHGIAVIYTAPSTQCVETSMTIQTAALRRSLVCEEALLSRRNWGEWDGLTQENIDRKLRALPSPRRSLIMARHTHRPSGGESGAAAEARIRRWLEWAKHKHAEYPALAVVPKETARALAAMAMRERLGGVPCSLEWSASQPFPIDQVVVIDYDTGTVEYQVVPAVAETLHMQRAGGADD